MASTAPAPITDPIDPASPLGRVITFFHTNRDESLNRSDAAAKLCCAPAAVDKLLTPGIQAGYIDTCRSPEDGYVWRAGKAIKTWKGAQVARPAAPGAGGTRMHLPPLDA